MAWREPLRNSTPEEIARNFETNFFGALAVIRAALPILRAQRSGHVVNISAAAAIENYPGLSIYGASKAALAAVSESLRLELKPLGINVTIVEPGPFRTNFVARSLVRAQTGMPEYDAVARPIPSPSRINRRQTTRRPGESRGSDLPARALRHSTAPPRSRQIRQQQSAQKIRRSRERTRRLGARRPFHGFRRSTTQPETNATSPAW